MLVCFSSRRLHTRYWRDWSSDVCSSDLLLRAVAALHPDLPVVGAPPRVVGVELGAVRPGPLIPQRFGPREQVGGRRSGEPRGGKGRNSPWQTDAYKKKARQASRCIIIKK